MPRRRILSEKCWMIIYSRLPNWIHWSHPLSLDRMWFSWRYTWLFSRVSFADGLCYSSCCRALTLLQIGWIVFEMKKRCCPEYCIEYCIVYYFRYCLPPLWSRRSISRRPTGGTSFSAFHVYSCGRVSSADHAVIRLHTRRPCYNPFREILKNDK